MLKMMYHIYLLYKISSLASANERMIDLASRDHYIINLLTDRKNKE